MLSGIDPGAPAAIRGYIVNEHIARLSSAALQNRPLQPVMESIVAELGFDSFMYGMSADPSPTRRDTRTFVWTTLPREWVDTLRTTGLHRGGPASHADLQPERPFHVGCRRAPRRSAVPGFPRRRRALRRRERRRNIVSRSRPRSGAGRRQLAHQSSRRCASATGRAPARRDRAARRCHSTISSWRTSSTASRR